MNNLPLPTTKNNFKKSDFIVPDPHVVYFDAVLNSSWNEDGDGRLPGHEDWSTVRCASKDVVVGVATYRFNRQTRRLEIRAYFVGEHPIFKSMEPTRVLMIMLISQAYQASGNMDLFFEQGIPFDVRLLIEQVLNIVLSGHEKLLKADLTQQLYAALSDFPISVQDQIKAQEIPIELVCFNSYRGNWSSEQIKSLVERGVRLSWIFKNRIDRLQAPVIYTHLLNHLRAVIMEQYAIFRLSERKMGVSAGKSIKREIKENVIVYRSEHQLQMPDPDETNYIDSDSSVLIKPNEYFSLIPVLTHSSGSIYRRLGVDLNRARTVSGFCQPVFVLPLDFIYLTESERRNYVMQARQLGVNVLVIGMTMSQLISEVELNLSVTASQIDENEMETMNVARYAD